jgi:ribose 5-phosphate isomerase B
VRDARRPEPGSVPLRKGAIAMTKVLIACDHGGIDLKTQLADALASWDYEVVDLGVKDHTSVNYPDYALKLGRGVVAGEGDLGVLVCGTGIGMSIAVNKVPGVRGALVSDEFSARMARQHNNANVVCLGGRVLGPDTARAILKGFLDAEFEGGRHQLRLDLIAAAENQG